ncbi:MAG: molybdopterin-dependent oxidoreductase [Bryobacteraceae bacterium]
MNDVDRQIRRRTRRSFLVGGAAALAGAGAWEWLRTRSQQDELQWPLRGVLRANEKIARTYFSEGHTAATFDVSQAGMPRRNGTEGIEEPADLARWKLNLVSPAGREIALGLDDIKALPRVEMVTELRCIEGWTQVVHWAGARLRDFAAKYQMEAPYVGMETPDAGYYVGLDNASALHPQTLLCYEMQGAPLTQEHGAPLRLVIPVKYGVKNIKRIGTIKFQENRPADYWAEQGYDWYAGL